MIADVILVFVEGDFDGDAVRVLDRRRGVDDAAAHRRQLGLLLARALGRDERIGADGLMRAHAAVPPLQEIPALGVKRIGAVDGHMVAADAALAVKKGWRKDPFVVMLDSLEEFDAANSRRGGLRRFLVGTDTILTTKAESCKMKNKAGTAAKATSVKSYGGDDEDSNPRPLP